MRGGSTPLGTSFSICMSHSTTHVFSPWGYSRREPNDYRCPAIYESTLWQSNACKAQQREHLVHQRLCALELADLQVDARERRQQMVLPARSTLQYYRWYSLPTVLYSTTVMLSATTVPDSRDTIPNRTASVQSVQSAHLVVLNGSAGYSGMLYSLYR
jgi:hypothetical protein